MSMSIMQGLNRIVCGRTISIEYAGHYFTIGNAGQSILALRPSGNINVYPIENAYGFRQFGWRESNVKIQ